jgi:hypothetical protein
MVTFSTRGQSNLYSLSPWDFLRLEVLGAYVFKLSPEGFGCIRLAWTFLAALPGSLGTIR